MDILKAYDVHSYIASSLLPNIKMGRHTKSGDALFIDTDLGIVAVADGPERNPSASALFLERFRDSLVSLFFEGCPISFEETSAEIERLLNRLMATTDYHNSTTFSAVFFDIVLGERAAIFHIGDSLIFKITPENSRGRLTHQISRTNHFLIGRSPRLFQIEIIPVSSEDIMLLSTDGITDLARSLGKSADSYVSDYIRGKTPREIVDEVIGHAKDSPISLDDIGIVCARPFPKGCGRFQTKARTILKY